MNIKAVAFDIDGTLYPNSAMYRHSLPMFLANIPLILAMGQVRKEIRDLPDPIEFHKSQARHLAAHLKTTPEHAFALIEGKIYTKWFRIFKKLKPYPGLTEVLELIRQRGLRLAVMSDFPIRNRLTDLGLTGPWDTVFSSEDTGFLKPNPQPFLRIASDLGLAPAEILYIGNSYTYDVQGAKAAGMAVAHLTRRVRRDSQADFSFKNYAQLRDFLLKILPPSTKTP